ncbi:hypothetical protein LFM09_33335 [Lentzea alba]|uniref:hypothetical protein n=1 Tax=Lentzea alba TaxID=2714351 RepID=UPI0039BFBCE1
MALTMNEAGREIRQYRCECCQEPVERIWNHVLRDGTAIAMFFANCYHHSRSEVVVDVVLGTWDRLDHPDHVTFAAKLREVDQSSLHPAFQLVPPVYGRSGAPLNGRVLQPDEARTHLRFAEFVEVLEFVVLHDPTVNQHLYGA